MVSTIIALTVRANLVHVWIRYKNIWTSRRAKRVLFVLQRAAHPVAGTEGSPTSNLLLSGVVSHTVEMAIIHSLNGAVMQHEMRKYAKAAPTERPRSAAIK